MSEVLTSFKDRFPVDDRAFQFPLPAEIMNTVLAKFQPLRTEGGKAALVIRASQRFANREQTGRVITVSLRKG